MFEKYITDEIKDFFAERDEEKTEEQKKIAETEERWKYIESIYEERISCIRNVFYPAIEKFYTFIKSKDIECKITPLSELGNDRYMKKISISISLADYRPYIDRPWTFIHTDIEFAFKYEPRNLNDEIEFYKEYGIDDIIWRRIEEGSNTAIKAYKTDKMKFSDVDEDFLLKELFNWFNKLIGNDGILLRHLKWKNSENETLS
jgi:hypothetical protein